MTYTVHFAEGRGYALSREEGGVMEYFAVGRWVVGVRYVQNLGTLLNGAGLSPGMELRFVWHK